MPNLLLSAVPIELQAAAQDRPARLAILAYTGGAMRLPGWGDVALDLAGIEAPDQVPLLADHENHLAGIVGHGRPRTREGQLLVEGTLSGATEPARQVLALAREGFRFQASVGLEPLATEPVAAGQSVALNGRTLAAGPDGLLVIRRGRLREVSITAIGADGNTSVTISAAYQGTRRMDLDFTNWLQAHGFDPAALSETQRHTLRASFDHDQAHDAHLRAAAATPADELRSAAAAEADRIAAIRRACAAEHYELQAQAIREGWDAPRVELEILRASRPAAPPIYGPAPGQPGAATVIEGAILASLGAETLGEKALGAAAMERARALPRKHILDVLEAGCRLLGLDPGRSKDSIIKAAFSTYGLAGILGNAANKLLLDAYDAFPSIARTISRKLTARDFKEHTGYRLTGETVFEQLGGDGQLEHGTLDEQSYRFAVDTYGKMFGISRRDIINDDLHALDSIPRMIGRGAALKLEDLFWNLVLGNAGQFFSTAHGNLIDNPLDAAGLAAGVTAMLKLTDTEGNPINVLPRYLAVPPELKAAADELYASRTWNTGAASASQSDRLPSANPFYGLYQPLTSPYLSNARYPGASATAWLLCGAPGDVAAFGIAYLGGLESPTVEQQDAPFDMLGVQFRGYIDFGVCQIDHRGALLSSGDAQA